MQLTPELLAEYEAAAIPFLEGDGAIKQQHARMKSWRYFLEINSACNLACPTCTKGNKEGYDHLNGIMPMELMEQCLDKIRNENNQAIVFLYGNSEPFLHPKLHECIAAVKARGLRCELSSNLNYVHHLEETLAAKPDYMIISLSGFTQDIYVRGHHGGNIEKVKKNMKLIAEANNKADPRITISVNYHIYNDNEHELPLMKAYCDELGLGLFTSLARAISMENAIQYCRSKDPEATPYEVQSGRPDWNVAFPPIGKTYIETCKRLKIPPDQAREMYKDFPSGKVCPVGAGSMFTFIRHDGKVQLCACTADRRITLGDYLSTNVGEMIERRTDHSICQQCMKYRTNLYFHIADRDKWKTGYDKF